MPSALLNEETLSHLEAHIPALAECALRVAYFQALTSAGKVLIARNGQLLEVHANGQERVLRAIAAPVSVPIGTKRIRPRAA